MELGVLTGHTALKSVSFYWNFSFSPFFKPTEVYQKLIFIVFIFGPLFLPQQAKFVTTCLSSECPRLSLPNGEITPDTASQTLSPIGTTVSFTCLPGNTINGSEVLSCQDDGTWNETVPVCNVNSKFFLLPPFPELNILQMYFLMISVRCLSSSFRDDDELSVLIAQC